MITLLLFLRPLCLFPVFDVTRILTFTRPFLSRLISVAVMASGQVPGTSKDKANKSVSRGGVGRYCAAVKSHRNTNKDKDLKFYSFPKDEDQRD